MAIWGIPARLWTIARQFEELLKLQAQTRTTLEAIESRLRSLEDRMTHLEAGQAQLTGQAQLITEAKAAAGIAATGLAGSVISEMVTRLTRVG
jgi:TolA-binding protein